MSVTKTVLISANAAGEEGNDWSYYESSVSADGRYAAFYSNASNLVPGDTNGAIDVFVKDLLTGTLTRVTTSSSGEQSNGSAFVPAISDDGQLIVYSSFASNVVPGDTNGQKDVFAKDLQTGVATLVSATASGAQANGSAGGVTLSGDGHFVAFQSDASNMVTGDTNGVTDLFVRNLRTGALALASTSSTGVHANGASANASLSADGRFVAFQSDASNLVAGDTNTASDVFIKDLLTGQLTLVSTGGAGAANGASAFPSLSADGRYVAFHSAASNLTAHDVNGVDDVFVKDRLTGNVTLVSSSLDGDPGNGRSFYPSISADGRFVCFTSSASDLVPGDTNLGTDVFVKDLVTGQLARASVNDAGGQAAAGSYWSSISADGRYVTYESLAANLVPGDTNHTKDVFVSVNPLAGTGLSAGGDTWIGTGGDEGRFGLEGNDSLDGKEGNDRLWGDEGSDTLVGGVGDDKLYGGEAADVLRGGYGYDLLAGGADADSLFGDQGNDTLKGEAGNDFLQGYIGDDHLFGGAGRDTVRGEAGNDTLDGGGGSDILVGDAGADVYVLRAGDGFDTVEGFAQGVDKIALADGVKFADLSFIQVGGSTKIAVHGHGEMLVLGSLPDAFDASDFILA